MLEDVYDLLAMVVDSLARGGAISEVIHRDAHALIAKIDPKIEAKRQAAQAAQAQQQAEYAEFLAYKAYKEQAAQQAQAPVASSSPAPVAPAATFVPPAGGFPVAPAASAVPAVPVG